MFVMLYLPEKASGEEFASKLIDEYKVAVVPGRPFYTDGSGANTVRLNFSRPSKNDIREAVKRIGELYKRLYS